tara:strand:+ start:363 stop:1070 length:708 start_codon:yes stop_codon:yes gene_type:complete
MHSISKLKKYLPESSIIKNMDDLAKGLGGFQRRVHKRTLQANRRIARNSAVAKFQRSSFAAPLTLVLFVAGLYFITGSLQDVQAKNQNLVYPPNYSIVTALANPNITEADSFLISKISYKPKTLLSLKGADVTRLLSDPAFERKDEDVVVKQYRSQICVADFYFTVNNNSGIEASQLNGFRMRSRDAVIAEKMSDFAIPMNTEAEQSECFQSLLDEKNNKKPSSMQLALADETLS